jgi:Tuberculosis necrotizing toxin
VTMTTADARRRLDQAGVLDRDVVLPGEVTASVRQGVLRVVQDGAWEVRAEEYGETTRLARTSDEAEALEYVIERVTTPLPAPLLYPKARLLLQQESMARMVAPIAARLREQPDAHVVTELPEGAVVDRLGTFDGARVHPTGTPLGARSLPPDALEPRVEGYGLLTFGVVAPVPVRARLVPPWFGQPGGAVVFNLAGEDPTVRDAVRRGRLRWLQIVDDGGDRRE